MKKLLVLIVCLTFVFSISAMNQKDEKIPVAVKSGFAAEFPTTQKVKWSLEKPGEFEAEFIQNSVKISALFDIKGTLLETETEIMKSELPQAVKATLAKDFIGYKLDEIERVTDMNGTITYEMEVAKGKEKQEVTFDMAGMIVK